MGSPQGCGLGYPGRRLSKGAFPNQRIDHKDTVRLVRVLMEPPQRETQTGVEGLIGEKPSAGVAGWVPPHYRNGAGLGTTGHHG